MEEVEFEVRCDGEPVASAVGPREDALREARHYAAVYAQDGVTEIFEVTRKKVANA
jgi:hypothetical protein